MDISFHKNITNPIQKIIIKTWLFKIYKFQALFTSGSKINHENFGSYSLINDQRYPKVSLNMSWNTKRYEFLNNYITFQNKGLRNFTTACTVHCAHCTIPAYWLKRKSLLWNFMRLFKSFLSPDSAAFFEINKLWGGSYWLIEYLRTLS